MSAFDPSTFATLSVKAIADEWTTTRDIPYLVDEPDAARQKLCLVDVFHPKAQSGTPVLVYLHGGGLSGGTRHELPELLKHLGCVLVTAEYRLYPAARYPDFIEDAAAALAWTKHHATEFGGDPDRVFVTGHSAGAHLVACLALMPEFLKPFGMTPFDFAGFISVSGSMVTHFAIQKECHGTEGCIVIDEKAPINRAAEHTPPLLLLTGDTGLDMPGRAADNKLMGDALAAHGNKNFACHEVPGMDHGSVMDAAYAYLLKFIRRLMTPPAAS